MRLPIRQLLGSVATTLVMACTGSDTAPTALAPLDIAGRSNSASHDQVLDAVLTWNALSTTIAPSLAPAGPLAPFVEARLHAITNLAMHDALNAIKPRFERYADAGDLDPRADAAAAVIAAGHAAVVGATPASAHPTATAVYDAGISSLRASAAGPQAQQLIDAGLAIGARAAAAVLANRADDGTAGGGVAPYTPGNGIGDYRFTFPFNTPGFDFFGTGGFADAGNWGASVRTFVVENGAQFRAPAPYAASDNAAAVLTPGYTADFLEVQSLGCATCAMRSAEQSEIALFWVENSPPAWNRIARTLAAANHFDAWKTARLLALVQMAEFDSYTTSLESKYYYNFWRPVTAIALADADNNPTTAATPGWEVAAFPTPPVPDYPSAHAVAGGAAAAVIGAVVPRSDLPFTASSLSLPAVVRAFDNVEQAARENADSRVFVGFHFRHATDVGLAQGLNVGRYIAARALRPGR